MKHESRDLGGALRAVALLVLVTAAGMLGGCVTTTESAYGRADKDQEVQRRVDAATQYLQQGNTERAVEHLRRALELDPNDATIHATLGQVFWQTGEYELAEEHFRRALSVDPKFSRGRNNYAAFLYDRGRYEEAARQLEIVVDDTLYDARASAFLNLGKSLQKLGRTLEAEEAYSRAVKMDTRQWPAMLELAEINFARQDYAVAQRYYDGFRRNAPAQSPRSLMLGIRLARVAGDKDAEASYALQLKSLYPTSDENLEYSRSVTGPQ